MTAARPPLLAATEALYLDFDGTLADFAPRPDRVVVPQPLPELLIALHHRLGGAVAVVSGRALADVDRLLASNPRHSEGLDLKKAILYEHGKAQLEASNYAASVEALTQLARIAPDYQDGTALLRQARGRLVQHHYAEGLRLYRNEKLEEAIAQWRTVLQLDPRHPNAQRNIEQAERILKTLEQRQKR